jgi:hypothetical protein
MVWTAAAYDTIASFCLAHQGSAGPARQAAPPSSPHVWRSREHSGPTGQLCQAAQEGPERQMLPGLMSSLSHACDWGRSHSHPGDSPLERLPAGPVCSLPPQPPRCIPMWVSHPCDTSP